MRTTLRSWYYQQFDADFCLEVPAEGYGGWKHAELPLELEHTALVLMHAWDAGSREQYPGWHRAVECLSRSYEICRTVLVPLLAAARGSGLRVYHVVSGGRYSAHCPGYQRALRLAGAPEEPPRQLEPDEVLEELQLFRREHGFPGRHNIEDIDRGLERLTFAVGTEPVGEEGVAENGAQLGALCREDGINHLVYAGFAINWCLLLSPGGMAEMSRRGALCSALRQAVTAVENRETARAELCKQLALWRVSLAFGFVYDVVDFMRAISARSAASTVEPSS